MVISVVSTGSFLPGRPVRNEDFGQFPPGALKLISVKTGVESRYKADDGQYTSDLAIEAARRCLSGTRIDAADIDAVILATSTPDRLIPATAAKVASSLGADRAFAFDMNSVCSGSLFLLEVARGLISGGSARRVLAIAADTYSRFLNPGDFSTFPYFGDGAGAVLLSSSEGEGAGTLGDSVLHTDGAGYEVITIKGGAGEMPCHAMENKADAFFKMNGRAVFEFATTRGPEVIRELLDKSGLACDSVTQVILHQANINIVNRIADSLGMPESLFFTNLERCGNTAGASVLIALDEYLSSGSFVDSGHILLCSFGGGLSWGATSISLKSCPAP